MRTGPSLNHHSAKVALMCLIAAMVVPACGEQTEPATEPPPTTSRPATITTLPAPTTTTTQLPTTTTVPPTTTAPQTAAAEASDESDGLGFDRYTVWQDVFDTLTSSEQSCINDAVGAELDWVLKQPILDEDEISQEVLAVLPCLPPQVVKAVFLAGMMLGMEDDGVQVGDEQEACLREVVGEMDVAALMAVLASESGASEEAAGAEYAAQLLEMMAGLLRCLPELFDAGGEGPDDFADGVEGAARLVVGKPVEGVLDYEGDSDYFVFEAVEGELYEVEVDLGTLSDSVVEVYNADGLSLDYNDDRGEDGSLASRLLWRAPVTGDFYVEVSGYGGEGSYVLMVAVSE